MTGVEAQDRPRDRLGLEVLPPEECWDLIATTPVGRVAFLDAGEPVVFPVTHSLHGRRIVFRSTSGTKLDAAQKAAPVAFEVDDWDAATRRGWSVVVRGTAEAVYDEDEVATYESSGSAPWMDAAADGTWIRILATDVSGRRLTH